MHANRSTGIARDLAYEAQSIVSSIFRGGRGPQQNNSDTGVFSANVSKTLKQTARAIEDATEEQQAGFDELFDLLEQSIDTGQSIQRTEEALLKKMEELINKAYDDSERNPKRGEDNDKFVATVQQASQDIKEVPKSSVMSTVKNNFIGGLAGAGFQEKVAAKKAELAEKDQKLGIIGKAKLLFKETTRNSVSNLSNEYDRMPYGNRSGFGNNRVRDFAGDMKSRWNKGNVSDKDGFSGVRKPKEGSTGAAVPNRKPRSIFEEETLPRVREYDEMVGKGRGRGRGKGKTGKLTAVEVMSDNFGKLMLEVGIIRSIMQRKEKNEEQGKIAGRVDKNLMDDHGKLNGSDAPTSGNIEGSIIPVGEKGEGGFDGAGSIGPIAAAGWLATKAKKGFSSLARKVRGMRTKAPAIKAPGVRPRDAKGRYVKMPLATKGTGLKGMLSKAKGFGTKMMERVGVGTAAKKVAGSAAKKEGIKLAEKSLGKAVIKKIPILGLLAGAGFAAQRFMSGDKKGAGMELLSGAASTIPGIGTAASIGIDAKLAYDDFQKGKVSKMAPVRAKAVQEMTDGLDASNKAKQVTQVKSPPIIIPAGNNKPPSIPKSIGGARTLDNSFLRFQDKRVNRVLS
jgi:hypothetical protein